MDPVLQWTSALTLALVFGVAAAGKFASWAELEGVVLNYRIAPRWMAPLIARALPPVEALVALGLLVPETRVPSAWVCLTMLVVFAAAMAVNIARGRTDIDCGCFRSSLRQNLSWWLVLRNAILAVGAMVCLAVPGERALGWADNFVVVMASLVLLLAYLSTGYVTLRRPPTYEENYERSLSGRS